ncbi:MAG: Hsp20/alpha crystallin family protein, partial [Flavobacterium sp.]
DEYLRADRIGGSHERKMSIPAVNIIENEHNFEIFLAAAGRDKGDFNLEIENQLLTISSKTKEDFSNKEGIYTRREFFNHSFSRSFTLPDSINNNEIKASYENGILKIILPKKEEALSKVKRLIAVA